MPIIRVKNNDFYYEQHGSGEDLVLISGFTADHAVWSAMLGTLAQSYRVLIFDNPGTGRSFIPHGDYSLEAMTQDILGLLDHLGIEQAYFMGHSMGAGLLLQICLEQPQRVKKAMLCGGVAAVPITAKLQIQSLHYALEHEFPHDYIGLALLPWLYGRRFLSDSSRVEKLKAKLRGNPHAQTLEGFRAQVQIPLHFDISDRLKEISAECLVVASDEDLLIPMHCAQFLKDNLLNARLEIIGEGVGHMFHIEEPQQLSQLALQFFTN